MPIDARCVNLPGIPVHRHCKSVARASHPDLTPAATDLDFVLHPRHAAVLLSATG
jgi:hypothetical protein